MNEMTWIVAKSLKYRYLVIFVAAVLIIFGVGQIGDMPVDVFPEFAPPRVEIQTPALGLSSAEVEALITIPLEEALAGTPGLDIMRSKSVEQLSSIKIIFEAGTDEMERASWCRKGWPWPRLTCPPGPPRLRSCRPCPPLPAPSRSGFLQRSIPSSISP